MRVIFCDVDGVLNHQGLYDANKPRHGQTTPRDWLCPTRIALLDALCRRTKACVVISSSWRTYVIPGTAAGRGWQAVAELLAAAGLSAEVIGGTPDLSHRAGAFYMAPDRGDEIRAWLAENPEVTRWVVLDDQPVAVPLEHFVQTSLATGLTPEACARAADILVPE